MERPREKLLHFGAPALSNAELIAILFGAGTAKIPLMEICDNVIKLIENHPPKLKGISIEELCKIKGIGEIKAIVLSAALELGTRCSLDNQGPITLATDEQISNFLMPYFQNQRQPGYFLVMLNNRKELLATHEIQLDKKKPPALTNILKIVLDTGAQEILICRKELRLSEKYLSNEKAFVIQLDAAASMFNIRMRGLLIC